jgi:hypothetical protein
MIIQYMKYPSIMNFQKDKYILSYIFIRSNIPYQVCNVNLHIPLGKKNLTVCIMSQNREPMSKYLSKYSSLNDYSIYEVWIKFEFLLRQICITQL